MINNPFLNEFMQQASKLIPNQQTREELQKSFNVIAQSTLAKLDLVTREEFDAQTAVLQRTRAKVEALEAQLQALSEQLNQQP